MTSPTFETMESLKQEYLRLAEKLHKLPPADPMGIPWVYRRKQIQAVLTSAGEQLPRLHEVRV